MVDTHIVTVLQSDGSDVPNFVSFSVSGKEITIKLNILAYFEDNVENWSFILKVEDQNTLGITTLSDQIEWSIEIEGVNS